MKSLLILLSVLLTVPGGLRAEMFYSYFDGTNGAIARVDVDPATGKIIAPEILYAEPVSHRLELLRLADDGKHLLCQNENNEERHLVVGDADGGPAGFARIAVTDRPRHFDLLGNRILVTGHEGRLHSISLSGREVLAESQPGSAMKTPAMRPEFVAIAPGGELGLATFLQDSASGQSRGGRLAVVALPSLELQHALVVPREHGQLDFTPGSKDRGPLPHRIFISPETNTLALLCRLYGAVALANLDAALAGNWENFRYVSTAPDGEFGTAFPETGSLFEVGGKHYLFASNASEAGGAAFIDLAKREVVAHVETGPRGLTAGVFLPGSNRLVAARSGFRWFRGDNELGSDHEDGKDLLVFDVAGLPQGEGVTLRQSTWVDYVYQIGLPPGGEDFLLTAVRTDENQLDLVSVDMNTLQPVDRVPSLGVMRNFVTRPGRMRAAAE